MRSYLWKQWKNHRGLKLYLECGATLFLFALSILIVACSGSASNGATNLNSPAVTVTIHLGTNSSPTPTQAPYSCGAWATNTSPEVNNQTDVGVYAKFVQLVDNNPMGVDGASATATVYWPNGGAQTLTATTTKDGLAVFSVPIADRADAVGRLTLITVTFSKPGVGDCTVDQNRAAYFTLAMGTPTATPTPTPGDGNQGNGNGNPKATPTATATLTPRG